MLFLPIRSLSLSLSERNSHYVRDLAVAVGTLKRAIASVCVVKS